MNSKNEGRDTVAAAMVKMTSRITGVTPRQVRRVINGEQSNDVVISTYMLFQEGNEELLRKAQEINRTVRKHAHA